jgi:hypothetical protein
MKESMFRMVMLLCLAGLSACAQPAAPPPNPGAQQTPQAKVTPRIPAYHDDVAQLKSWPKTLDPQRFSSPVIAKGYRIARELPQVLAQQPCYCYCDDSAGHGGLLDCFVDQHGAG